MAKIILKTPTEHSNPYRPTINTDGVDVEIRDAFIGVSFITQEGEKLSVSMRDGGFEVLYSGDYGETGFNVGMIEFKNGIVRNQSDEINELKKSIERYEQTELKQAKEDIKVLREVFGNQIRNALFDGQIMIGSLGTMPSIKVTNKRHIETIRRVFGIEKDKWLD